MDGDSDDGQFVFIFVTSIWSSCSRFRCVRVCIVRVKNGKYLNCFERVKWVEAVEQRDKHHADSSQVHTRSRQLCARTIKVLLFLDFIKIKMGMNISPSFHRIRTHLILQFSNLREMRKASVWLDKDKFKLLHTLIHAHETTTHTISASHGVGDDFAYACVCSQASDRSVGGHSGPDSFVLLTHACFWLYTDFLIRRF